VQSHAASAGKQAGPDAASTSTRCSVEFRSRSGARGTRRSRRAASLHGSLGAPDVSVSEVTVGELDGRRDVTLIDVREPEEFSEGHVPGARNIPLRMISDHVAELHALGTVYVICQSGRRSAQAAALLDAADVPVVNVVGGTGAWIATGRPVEL